MTLDERAVMLAAAVSIDFDYFSRHSHMGHGGIMPIGVFGGGYSEHNQPGQVSGAAGDVGAGMMGGAVGGAMGGMMGGHYGDYGEPQQAPPQQEAQQQPEEVPVYSPYEQQMPSPYGDQPPPANPWQYGSTHEPEPFFPPQEQQSEDGGGGGFWFFDEEE
jgi:hypothetical protein